MPVPGVVFETVNFVAGLGTGAGFAPGAGIGTVGVRSTEISGSLSSSGATLRGGTGAGIGAVRFDGGTSFDSVVWSRGGTAI